MNNWQGYVFFIESPSKDYCMENLNVSPLLFVKIQSHILICHSKLFPQVNYSKTTVNHWQVLRNLAGFNKM